MQALAGADPIDFFDEQSASDDSNSSTESSSDTETQSLGSASDRTQAPTSRAAAATNRRRFFGEDSSSDGSISSFLDAFSNRVQSHRNGECVANWQTWAAAADAEPGEQRATALNRVIEWVNIGNFDAKLGLSSLDLSSRLPALPQGLKHLNISVNKRFEFTELPESLETFDAYATGIEVLPQLSHTRLRFLTLFMTQIREIPELPPTLIKLDASCCENLSRLRTLPPDLQHLKLNSVNAGNPIELPPLPQTLITLDISNSRFVNFPQLPDSLEDLSAYDMELDTLPSQLPANLRIADFSGNNLAGLPSVLPASLTMLELTDNQFVSVPPSVFSSLTHRCTVEFYGNPIPAEQWRDMVSITEQADYRGPQIGFDISDGTNSAVARPLPDAVLDWYEPAGQPGVGQTWNAIDTEEDASATSAFSRFLDALAISSTAEDPTARGPFSQSVRDLIDNMAASPELRADCFSIALEGVTSCQDRATLYFEQMALPRLAESVRQGEFANDAALPDFCQRVRALYRRSALTDIAARKVASMTGAVDPIEVHLALQTRLNAPMELGLDATMMAYEAMSGLNADDLVQAEREVKAMENEHFENYLVTQNGPWEVLFQQRNPDLFSSMLSAKNAVFEDLTVVEQTARERLTTSGLPIDADSRLEMERLVSKELALQAQRPFVQQFMRECGHNPDQLLGPRWDLN